MAGTLIAGSISNGARSSNVEDLLGSKVLAWLSFSPTGGNAIAGSFNVGSVTDNGVGRFTINFAQALPHANYVICGGGEDTDGQGDSYVGRPKSAVKTAAQSQITTLTASGSIVDFPSIEIAFIG